MRPRREIYAVLTVIVACILVVLGTIWFQTSFESAQIDAPERHDIVEDAPREVQDPPPEATGSIDEP
jgi:hypothetical protein